MPHHSPVASEAFIRIFDGPGQPLRGVSHPFPDTLGAGEVLTAIRLATICGSDLHTLAGHRTERTPCILGHEAVGHVVALGPGRDDVAVGDRITWSIANSCGQCDYCTGYRMPEKCASVFKYGHAPLNDGAGLNGCYATHIVLRPGTHIVRIGDTLPDRVVAPANCALATVTNAVSHIPETAGCVMIQGAGLLGLYACAVLHERGVEHVFCVDINEQRLGQIARFGGIAIDGRPDRYPQSRQRIEDAASNGVDAVLEVAGVSGLIPEGIRLLRTGGFYIFAGMVHPATQLDITGEQIIRKCLTIRGIHNYSPWHLDQAIDFLTRTVNMYPYDDLISPSFALADLDEAIGEAQAQTYCRVSVRP